ncbi:unnamed protein product [Phytophthora lilii]|uniref:Unnamed protein product n=1 Tax=Phytophthora lilii TaxID=2077276 RepID=A0A9W6TQW2_9STRA|nr:unnamed protein product [Phytophthora lilii]
MIMDILKIDERNSTRESSQHHSRSRDSTRRREERRREDSRDDYSRRNRRDRDYDRRRDDSRNDPGVTLAEALVPTFSLNYKSGMSTAAVRAPRNTQRNIPNSGSEADSDGLSDDSRQLSDTRSDGYSSDGSGRYLAAANDNERRDAAEGTYAPTSRRASVKITLGWERVYVFDVWIMDHNAGVDVILGTDFMILAGVRLDLFNAIAKLPDEVMVPLIKTQNTIDETEGSHVVGGPTEVLQIPGREWRDFRLQRRQPPPTTRRLESPHRGVCADDYSVLQAETSPRTSHEPHRQTSKLPSPPTSGGLGTCGFAPTRCRLRETGFSEKSRVATRQPSAVEKPAYTTQTGILQRPPDDSEDEMSSADDWSNDNDESVAAMGDANLEETHNDNYKFETTSAKNSGEHTDGAEPEDIGSDNSQTAGVECKVLTMSPLQVLENTFISVIRVLTTEGNEASNTSADNSFEHLAAEIGLENYAHELAFLPI